MWDPDRWFASVCVSTNMAEKRKQPVDMVDMDTDAGLRKRPSGLFALCSRFKRFYSAAALHAMQSAVIPTAIPFVRLSVCLSVRLSVTRWYPIQTNEHRITRSSLWVANTL